MSNSLMKRCGTGRTMTVTDPAHDGVIASGASAEYRRAVAANPDAFDLLRASLKTGNGILCVSVTFADEDPSAKRGISLNVATARPRLNPEYPLASLEYGTNKNVALFAGGGYESEPIDGERISGVRGRVVELAIPLKRLFPISDRGATPSPTAFTWRLDAGSDCIPRPRQLIRYPTAQLLALPSSPRAPINSISAGCT